MADLSPALHEQYFRIRLDPYGLHHTKGSEHRSRCPFHDGSNNSAFWVDIVKGNFYCFACAAKGGSPFFFEMEMLRRELNRAPMVDEVNKSIETVIGQPFIKRVYTEPLKATTKGWDRSKARDYYRYTDEIGQELFTVWRFVDRNGKKATPPDHPCPHTRNPDAECEDGCDNGRVWGSKGIRRVLYRLPDVIQSSLVFVVEGEKNANDLSRAFAEYIRSHKGFELQDLVIDRVAVTTNPGGAMAWKKEYNYGRYFYGKIVVKLGDNDAQGREHDRAVMEDLYPYALKLFKLDLPVGEGEDISDYLERHTLEDLVNILPHLASHHVAKRKQTLILDNLEPRRLMVPPSELADPGDGTDWLVHKFIPRGGRGLIVAKPKTGKSLLFLDIGVALSNGQGVWGEKSCAKPLKVGIISREDGPQLVAERIRQIAKARNLTMAQVDRNMRVNTEAQSAKFKIDNQRDLDEMAAWIRMEGIEFCVLDVLVRLHHGKENSADDMGQIMLKFDELGQKSGAQICVIHHANAAGEGRGSSAIDGWADYIFKLESDADDQTIKTLSVRTKATGLAQSVRLKYGQTQQMDECHIMKV